MDKKYNVSFHLQAKSCNHWQLKEVLCCKKKKTNLKIIKFHMDAFTHSVVDCFPTTACFLKCSVPHTSSSSIFRVMV